MKTELFLNLHYVLVATWRRRYLIVVPIFIMPVISLIAGSIAPKKYASHTTILIQETSKLNPFLADLAVSTQLKERMAALQALLHSRHMLGEVALELGLIAEDKVSYDNAILSRLSRALRVELIGTDLIKIHLVDSAPEDMAQTLTVVSRHFLSKLLAPERSSIDASESFLETQLSHQQRALIEAELALASFKAEHSGSLPNQHQFDIEQLREIEKQLQIKQTELAGADAALQSFTTQLLKTNPILASIEQQIVSVSTRLSQLQSRYTNKHSQVIRVIEKLQRLQQERLELMESTQQVRVEEPDKLWQLATQLAPSQTNTLASSESVQPLLVTQLEAVEQAKSRHQQLKNEINQLAKVKAELLTRIERFAEVEQQLSELKRDISTKQRLYDDFLERYEMAKITGALGKYEEHDRVKIIDKPYTPGAPTNLPLMVYGIAGIVGGLVLGSCLALLLETVDTSIERREALERELGLPVLARLPNFNIQPEAFS